MSDNGDGQNIPETTSTTFKITSIKLFVPIVT